MSGVWWVQTQTLLDLEVSNLVKHPINSSSVSLAVLCIVMKYSTEHCRRVEFSSKHRNAVEYLDRQEDVRKAAGF